MSFDWIEHTTGLLHKIKFYIAYDKLFFLIDSFLNIRRWWIAQNHMSCSNCTIKFGMLQNSILIHVFLSWSISFFSYFNCLPDDVLCKIVIWADDNAPNSSCDKPSHLSQQVVIWSEKYEYSIPEISVIPAILHPIKYWYLGNYSIFTN